MKGEAVGDTAGSAGDAERQIVQAREDLAQSIDELVDRVHPKKAAQRSMAQLKARMGLAKQRSVTKAQDLKEVTAGKTEELKQRSVEVTQQGRHAIEQNPGSGEGGLPIRREYAIAAGVVVGVGAVVLIVWLRRRS
ncbi:MAG: DUF3618 domain-containing protein [Streptosporangiales bacterium]